ncbi:MAG TPA: threonine--tRNA ligase [Clostridia bacterium]|nr:threonine--tRNA ligase [Clostridia bacterium]
MEVYLKDGSAIQVEDGATVYDVACEISKGLARVSILGEVNGEIVDVSYEVEPGDKINLLKMDTEESMDAFRHTSAHIMAQAIKRLYPGTKLAIGPTIDNGFYYDIDSEHTFVEEDLEKIEKEMKKIVKEKLEVERFELPRDEAIEFVKERDEDYKIELIQDLPEGETISFYKQGEFVDLCRGPHIPNTKFVKAFKLLSVAGAYWRGDESNKMLQRIYATSFPKASLLEKHLERLEEAKKRDHRKIGKEQELFALMKEGPGFPFFLPKGTQLKNTLMKYWREVHEEAGYVEIETPLILNRKLWETSGHWDHYQENMYTLKIDEEDYAIKPMNCPGGMMVYNTKLRSYRDFPIRMGEIGRVHRHELSGALHGLMRVRAFTQDDAHIFMLPSQIKDEIMNVVNLVDEVYKTFGFKYHIELSTRPEKSMGTDEEWEQAESSLIAALEELEVEYKLNPADGAFYGPKIDFHLEDCIGRTWQCGTIQLDMQLPQRFDLNYIGEDGNKHKPVVIHRVVYGSIERFIGILIEHFAGRFPTWLAPTQVKFIPVADRHIGYCEKLKSTLEEKDLQVEIDGRSEGVGYKIREAQLEQVPYMIIVGDDEVEGEKLAIRSRDAGELGKQTIDEFIDHIVKEIENKEMAVQDY